MANKGNGKKPRREYTVSSKALAQRRNNTALMPAETPEEKAYNARYIDHIMKVHELSTHAVKGDIVSLKSCFIAYLRLCQEDGFKVNNISAYASMGMTRSMFQYFKQKNDPEIQELVSLVQSICSMSRETLSELFLDILPVSGFFGRENLMAFAMTRSKCRVCKKLITGMMEMKIMTRSILI